MSEHSIRLRGAWQGFDLDSTTAEPFRLTLPVDWGLHGSPRRLRLVRKFGRPRSMEEGGSKAHLRLILDDVEGLKALILNDAALSWISPTPGRLVADLPALHERNVLQIEIDVPSTNLATPGEPVLWGSIAIVISE